MITKVKRGDTLIVNGAEIEFMDSANIRLLNPVDVFRNGKRVGKDPRKLEPKREARHDR